MKLSMIISTDRRGREQEREAFGDMIDYALFADSVGINPFFRERHFAEHELTASNSMLLAAYLAPQVKTYLGFGIVPITYHHPVRLVEDMNILDHLTKGKVIFGVGGGYGISPEPIGFGMTLTYALKSASKELFEILQELWAKKPEDPPLAFKTQAYSGHLLNRIVPDAYRDRTPIVIRTASCNEALTECARRGLPAFVGQYGDRSFLKEQVDLYRGTLNAANHPDEVQYECSEWMTARFAPIGVVLADTEADAERRLSEYFEMIRPTFQTYFNESMAEMRAASVIGGTPESLSPYFQKIAQTDEEERRRQECFAGTPEMLVNELKELRKMGIKHVIISVAGRWADPKSRAMIVDTMNLIRSDVIPHIHKLDDALAS